MTDNSVMIIKDLKAVIPAGRHLRLICMTGESRGVSYYIKGKRVVLGRGDSADIQVRDAKSSREHAEITLVGDDVVLTDLGSNNGVMVNDLKVSQHTLQDGDKVVIGKTVYKFSEIEVFDSEQDKTQVTSSTQVDLPNEKSKGGSKKLLIFLSLILGFMFLIGGGETVRTSKKKSNLNRPSEITDEFLKALRKKQEEEDKEVKSEVELSLHQGLREYRERNYFRAIKFFELALRTSPSNGRAGFYKRRAQQALDNEIQQNFLRARKELDAIRYDAAAVSYCSILRLLRGYEKDDRYLDAKDQLTAVAKNMGRTFEELECIIDTK